MDSRNEDTQWDAALRDLIPDLVSVSESRQLGGGCISQARRMKLAFRDRSQRMVVVKRNEPDFIENFRAETDGLNRLAQPGVIGVPKPVVTGIAGQAAWIVTEWVAQSKPTEAFFRSFGRDLARLHQATSGTEVGLERDNFLGAAIQKNGGQHDWVAFVAENRIGYQIRWAVDQGLADPRLAQDCQRIADRMDDLLDGREVQTSLIHGDLWSGNYLCDSDGKPALIDPAVYHGCREAEFGMLELFGSCPATFYQAYQDQFPLPDGWQRRVKVYVLYHLLNHLNLFGVGYLDSCRQTASQILKAGD